MTIKTLGDGFSPDTHLGHARDCNCSSCSVEAKALAEGASARGVKRSRPCS